MFPLISVSVMTTESRQEEEDDWERLRCSFGGDVTDWDCDGGGRLERRDLPTDHASTADS